MKEAAKEEIFHLKQSIGRARKRLDEDRAQPIDVLVQVVYLQESHPIVDPHFQPHHVFDGFRSEDLHNLLEEVQLFQVRLLLSSCTHTGVPGPGTPTAPHCGYGHTSLDPEHLCITRTTPRPLALVDEIVEMQALDVEQEEHVKYWKNVVSLMRMCMQDELAATGAVAAEGTGMDQAHTVLKVEEILQGSSEELEELQEMLHAELNDPHCPDTKFWRAVQAKCALSHCFLTSLP